MKFGRSGRFHELVERQLDLFATDDAELLAEATEAEAAWNSGSADERRGGLRRLPARRRRDRRPAARHP